MEERELNSNEADAVIGTVRSIISNIPIAGGYFTELLNDIPNQRIDRIAKYCSYLKSELDKIPLNEINELLKNPYVQDLLEEGFIQASRAITNDRKTYISSLVSKGIIGDDNEIVKNKFILKTLSEINDAEIILLNYVYFIYDKEKAQELHSKNKIVLEKNLHLDATENELVDMALKESYYNHLNALGLIEHTVKVNSLTKDVIFDSGGNAIIQSSKITPLGGYLLKLIGLTNSIHPQDNEFKMKNKVDLAKKILLQDLYLLRVEEDLEKMKILRNKISDSCIAIDLKSTSYNTEVIVKRVDGFINGQDNAKKTFENFINNVSRFINDK